MILDTLTSLIFDPVVDFNCPEPESHGIEHGHHDLGFHMFPETHHAQPEHVKVSDDFHLTIGEPDADRQWWNWQGFHQSCAVVAQQGVMESILHHDVSQSDLIKMATEKGWYDPATGTPPECVGNLLEANGIPIERHWGSSMTDIYDALGRGEKVIVGLNANEIWNPIHDAQGNPITQEPGGHAVWVTGIEVDPSGHSYVILNDSAPITGWHDKVAMEDFLHAWGEHNNFTVITRTQASA